MLSFAETCQMGVCGLLTNAANGQPVSGAVQITGQSRQVFSNPDQGFFDYMLLPGTYDLTFTAPGYVPRSIPNVTVPAGVGICLNVALMPVPEPGSIVWNGGDSSGPTNWDVAANWSPSTGVPDGPGTKVVFGGQSSGNNVVDMIFGGRTVGIITFAAITSTTIQNTGGYSLTLDNNGDASMITVEGNHTITAPVVLNDDAIITGSGTLNLLGGVTGAYALTITGSITATSIQVDTLTIGTPGTMAVPEPSTVTLLSMAGCGPAGLYLETAEWFSFDLGFFEGYFSLITRH